MYGKNKMEIDTNHENPAYWDKVLRFFKLGMNRGMAIKTLLSKRENSKIGHYEDRNIRYIGISTNLVRLEEKQIAKKTGRVRPKGYGAE